MSMSYTVTRTTTTTTRGGGGGGGGGGGRVVSGGSTRTTTTVSPGAGPRETVLTTHTVRSSGASPSGPPPQGQPAQTQTQTRASQQSAGPRETVLATHTVKTTGAPQSSGQPASGGGNPQTGPLIPVQQPQQQKPQQQPQPQPQQQQRPPASKPQAPAPKRSTAKPTEPDTAEAEGFPQLKPTPKGSKRPPEEAREAVDLKPVPKEGKPKPKESKPQPSPQPQPSPKPQTRESKPPPQPTATPTPTPAASRPKESQSSKPPAPQPSRPKESSAAKPPPEPRSDDDIYEEKRAQLQRALGGDLFGQTIDGPRLPDGTRPAPVPSSDPRAVRPPDLEHLRDDDDRRMRDYLRRLRGLEHATVETFRRWDTVAPELDPVRAAGGRPPTERLIDRLRTANAEADYNRARQAADDHDRRAAQRQAWDREAHGPPPATAPQRPPHLQHPLAGGAPQHAPPQRSAADPQPRSASPRFINPPRQPVPAGYLHPNRSAPPQPPAQWQRTHPPQAPAQQQPPAAAQWDRAPPPSFHPQPTGAPQAPGPAQWQRTHPPSPTAPPQAPVQWQRPARSPRGVAQVPQAVPAPAPVLPASPTARAAPAGEHKRIAPQRNPRAPPIAAAMGEQEPAGPPPPAPVVREVPMPPPATWVHLRPPVVEHEEVPAPPPDAAAPMHTPPASSQADPVPVPPSPVVLAPLKQQRVPPARRVLPDPRAMPPAPTPAEHPPVLPPSPAAATPAAAHVHAALPAPVAGTSVVHVPTAAASPVPVVHAPVAYLPVATVASPVAVAHAPAAGACCAGCAGAHACCTPCPVDVHVHLHNNASAAEVPAVRARDVAGVQVREVDVVLPPQHAAEAKDAELREAKAAVVQLTQQLEACRAQCDDQTALVSGLYRQIDRLGTRLEEVERGGAQVGAARIAAEDEEARGGQMQLIEDLRAQMAEVVAAVQQQPAAAATPQHLPAMPPLLAATDALDNPAVSPPRRAPHPVHATLHGLTPAHPTASTWPADTAPPTDTAQPSPVTEVSVLRNLPPKLSARSDSERPESLSSTVYSPDCVSQAHSRPASPMSPDRKTAPQRSTAFPSAPLSRSGQRASASTSAPQGAAKKSISQSLLERKYLDRLWEEYEREMGAAAVLSDPLPRATPAQPARLDARQPPPEATDADDDAPSLASSVGTLNGGDAPPPPPVPPAAPTPGRSPAQPRAPYPSAVGRQQAPPLDDLAPTQPVGYLSGERRAEANAMQSVSRSPLDSMHVAPAHRSTPAAAHPAPGEPTPHVASVEDFSLVPSGRQPRAAAPDVLGPLMGAASAPPTPQSQPSVPAAAAAAPQGAADDAAGPKSQLSTMADAVRAGERAPSPRASVASASAGRESSRQSEGGAPRRVLSGADLVRGRQAPSQAAEGPASTVVDSAQLRTEPLRSSAHAVGGGYRSVPSHYSPRSSPLPRDGGGSAIFKSSGVGGPVPEAAHPRPADAGLRSRLSRTTPRPPTEHASRR